MQKLKKAPAAHGAFVRRFPSIGRAWDLVAEAGAHGPLDTKTQRLVKLGIALGAVREGAVHSSVRKALAAGATPEELDQVVALAAGTVGFPTAVALHQWVVEEAGGKSGRRDAPSRRLGPRRAAGRP
jgi:4-carboxymuconolactone decarboxylase